MCQSCWGPCAPDELPIESAEAQARKDRVEMANKDRDAQALVKYSKGRGNAELVERSMTRVGQLIGLYAIAVGSMHMIFVPQRCAPGVAATCTLQANVRAARSEDDHVRMALLGLNGGTAASLLLCSLLFYRRELWMIRNLEHNPSEPYDRLLSQLPPHHTLAKPTGPGAEDKHKMRREMRNALRARAAPRSAPRVRAPEGRCGCARSLRRAGTRPATTTRSLCCCSWL